jgi:tRNA-dihydrouridine synthase B
METRLHTLGITFPYLIAPMVGLTHAAFRKLVRSYTPVGLEPLIFTEMLSTKMIPHESLSKTPELKVFPGEQRFVPQLLGNNSDLIQASIEKLLPLNPWGFDINMGCSVKHILKHNHGVALMGNKEYAAEIAAAAKKASPRPVSVKLRGAATAVQDEKQLIDFTLALQNAGVDWLSIHARPQSRKHKGEANWNLGAAVARELKIPVVLNGDIQTASDAISVVRNYQADGAMIGRAATARPWIFWQIAEDLGITAKPENHIGKSCPRTPLEEGREFVASTIQLLNYLEELFDNPDFICERIVFHSANAIPWLQFGHAFWKMTTKAKNPQSLREALLDFAERFEMTMTTRVQFL